VNVKTLPGKRLRLGEILLAANVITDEQLKAALAEQRKWGGKLGRTLVEMGAVDETKMVNALSQQLRLPMIDLDQAQVPAETLHALRLDIAERYGVFPLGSDVQHKTLRLATSDPTNVEALRELSLFTGMRIEPHVASVSGIDRAIRRHYYGESTTSVPTALPGRYGQDERIIDLDKGPTPTGTSGALGADVARLAEQVSAIERLVAGQVRALRGLLELLVDKKYLSREEYLAKVRSLADPSQH